MTTESWIPRTLYLNPLEDIHLSIVVRLYLLRVCTDTDVGINKLRFEFLPFATHYLLEWNRTDMVQLLEWIDQDRSFDDEGKIYTFNMEQKRSDIRRDNAKIVKLIKKGFEELHLLTLFAFKYANSSGLADFKHLSSRLERLYAEYLIYLEDDFSERGEEQFIVHQCLRERVGTALEEFNSVGMKGDPEFIKLNFGDVYIEAEERKLNVYY